ncbi:hypothetical protein Q5P01_019622 [Channa striata]|uniref:Uncharacterized protein n=1 Tax=Channa striata TaxID=64152 RepID=A0AA88M4E6_CHASR|nr:hypothetical protein Q5P01_019622 [Channa striata]
MLGYNGWCQVTTDAAVSHCRHWQNKLPVVYHPNLASHTAQSEVGGKCEQHRCRVKDCRFFCYACACIPLSRWATLAQPLILTLKSLFQLCQSRRS